MRLNTRRRLASLVESHGRRALGGEPRTSLADSITEYDARQVQKWVKAHGLTSPLEAPDLPDHERPAFLAMMAELDEEWDDDADTEEIPRPVAQRILVVGDTHTHPGQDLRRFDWLGRACEELRPHHLVLLGDHWSLDGACTHNSPSEREGMRFVEERDVGNEALRRITAAAPTWEGQRHLTAGNHGQGRADRIEGNNAYLEGVLDLYGEARAMGWNVVPFLEPLRLCGWRFQHYVQRANGRPATSTAAGHARAAMQALFFQESVCFGHTHALDYWRVRTERSPVRRGVSAGCYFEHREEYAGADSNARWWRGLLVFDNAYNGDADIMELRLETVRARWG